MKHGGFVIGGVIALAVAAFTVALWSGLSNQEQPERSGIAGMRTATVELPDGMSVVCVVTSGGVARALSCDWDHAS